MPHPIVRKRIGDFGLPDPECTLAPFWKWIAERTAGFAHAMIDVMDGQHGVTIHLEEEADYAVARADFPLGRNMRARFGEGPPATARMPR